LGTLLIQDLLDLELVQLHVLDQHAPQAYQLPLAQRRLVVVCVVKCGGGGGDGVWVGCRRGA
jgi:hypothetical protein